jgi:hypothetical protein
MTVTGCRLRVKEFKRLKLQRALEGSFGFWKGKDKHRELGAGTDETPRRRAGGEVWSNLSQMSIKVDCKAQENDDDDPESNPRGENNGKIVGILYGLLVGKYARK